MGTRTEHTTFYTYLDTPIGKLMLAGCRDHGLRLIAFPCGRRIVAPEPHWKPSAAPFREVSRQLAEYFRGGRTTFDVKLNLVGTAFQLEVWNALLAIPYGETRSYGQIAETIGRPRAMRAVGLANGRNPLPIVVPCHRVIGSTGGLVGYGGGLRVKEMLLALESKAGAGGRVGRRPSRSSGRGID
jgi:methylated-DNA-[protein]-cysteine S-methyltransferase